VGERYELLKVIGEGSFSVVCLARDKRSGDGQGQCGQSLVAVKKIRDVFVHKVNAKNVIREVYIQRRLRHPNVVELLDLFMMPSPTGRWKMVGGKLVTDSVDLYLVMEYIDGGDLFHLAAQLNEQEVKNIMDQLLLATQFLHSCGIIHRDIKSANILIKTDPSTGGVSVKLGDFGCARSSNSQVTMERNSSYGNLKDEEQQQEGKVMKMTPPNKMQRSLSSDEGDQTVEDTKQDRGADFGVAANSNSNGNRPKPRRASELNTMMTTAVATPCYRAPEVVMSLESYNSSIDVWSIGCIFAELLARLLSQLKGFCRNVRVVPLFNLTGQPRLYSGVNWEDGEGATMAHRELSTVFDVIGTPPWAQVERISDSRWKKFLQCLPGHAPKLMRRFPGLGEVFLDLLKRMLAFDPSSRCSTTEALSHEYFSEITKMNQDIHGEISIAHNKDKETFKQFELEIDSMLSQDSETFVANLKKILEEEIEDHRNVVKNHGKDRWKPLLEGKVTNSSFVRLNPSPAILDVPTIRDELLHTANSEPSNTMSLGADRHKDWTSSDWTSDPHWRKPAEPVWGVTKSNASHQQSR
jgi:mitogen-activated protein kinase 1/3